MSNKYEREFLEQYLWVWAFGKCPETGLIDMACEKNDTIATGLTQEQIIEISSWLDKSIDAILERFEFRS